MRKFHIVGKKNSGKTTLIVDLVKEFTSRGIKVGTIKHTHHHHEFDVPGKDSFQHREAGATIVGLVGPNMSAAFWESPKQTETAMDNQFESLYAECDLVLVEGNQQTTDTKVEVWRAATGNSPLARENASIVAIITDDTLEEFEHTCWPRHDVSALADRILKL